MSGRFCGGFNKAQEEETVQKFKELILDRTKHEVILK